MSTQKQDGTGQETSGGEDPARELRGRETVELGTAGDEGAGQGPVDPAVVELAHRLFDAARAGETALLERYVGAGVPVNLTNASGDNLLMLAAYHGHAQTVSYLISQGADVNTLNDRGQSPLAGAVFKGYADVAAALLAAGADADAGTPSARATAEYFQRQDILDQG